MDSPEGIRVKAVTAECFSKINICLYMKFGLVGAWQRNNAENSTQKFPENELRCLSPNFLIHVSVSDLYIPRIRLPILLQEYMWTDPGNI
jgi:hypothetical protein